MTKLESLLINSATVLLLIFALLPQIVLGTESSLDQAERLVRQGKVDSALSVLTARIVEIETISGGNDTTLIDLYRHRGLILLNTDRPKDAETLLVKAFELAKRLDSQNGYRAVSMTMDLGVCADIQERYQEAFDYDTAALNLHRSLDLPVDTLAVYSRSNLAFVLINLGDTTGAIDIITEAIALMDSVPTSADTSLGRVAFSMGAFLYSVSEYRTSIASFEQAERFFTAALGPNSSWSVLMLMRAAFSWEGVPDAPKAKQLYHEALMRSRPINRTDSTVFAGSAGQLARLYSDSLQYDSSAAYYQLSLKWYLALHDTTTMDVATASENLADSYYNDRTDTAAISLLMQAIEWRNRYSAQPDLSQIGYDLNRIGNIVFARLSEAEAVPYYRRAVTCYVQAGDTLGGIYLTVLGNLGSTLSGTDPVAAESVYIRLMPLMEKYSKDTLAMSNACGYYGLTLLKLNRTEESEVYYRLARDLREAQSPGGSDNYMSWRNLAYVTGSQGRMAEADSLYTVASSLLQSQSPVDTTTLAEQYAEMGKLWSDKGNLIDGANYYYYAWQLYAAQGEFAVVPATNTMALLSYVLSDAEEFVSAESLLIGAIRVVETRAPDSVNEILMLHEARAIVNIRQKNYASAIAEYKEVVQRLYAIKPLDTIRFATNLGLLGWVARVEGEYALCREVLLESYGIWKERLALNPRDTLTARNLGDVCSNLGKMHEDLSEDDRATVYYQQALAIADSVLPPGDRDVINWHIKLIDFLTNRQKFAELEPYLRQITSTVMKVYGEDDTTTLSVLTRQATVDVLTGNVFKGQTLVRKIVDARRRLNALDNVQLADAMILLALGHRSTGNYVEAEQMLKRVISEQQGTEYFDASTLSQAQAILGELYMSQWKLAEAESLYTALLTREREQFGENPSAANYRLLTLNSIYTLQGRFAQAQQTIDTIAAMCEADTTAAKLWTKTLIGLQADLAFQRGDFASASQFYQDAKSRIDTTVEADRALLDIILPKLARSLLELRQYAAADSSLPTIDSTVVRNELASSRQTFEDIVVRGHILRERGWLDTAQVTYQQVLQLVAGHELRYTSAYAGALIGMGDIELERQRFATADSLFTEAASFLYRYLGERHSLYSEALLGLARVNTLRGQFAQAGEGVNKAISAIRRILGESHPLLASAYDVQGQLFTQQARFADADSSFLMANRILTSLKGQQTYGDLIYKKRQAELAMAKSNPSDALVKYGDVIGPILTELGYNHSEVISAFLQSASVLLDERLYAYVDTVLSFFDGLKKEEFGQRPMTLTGADLVRGRLAMARGDFGKAEKVLRDVLVQRRIALGDDNPSLGECYASLGDLYTRQNRLDEAERARKMAVAVYKGAYGELHPLVAKSQLQLAEWLRDQGEYGEAEVLFREALQTFYHIYGSGNPNTAASLHGLARLHQMQGHPDEAITLLNEEYAINSVLSGQDAVAAINMAALGDVHYEIKQYAMADTFYSAARIIFKSSPDSTSFEVVPTLIGLGRTAAALGDWPRALEASHNAYQFAHAYFLKNALALSEADALSYSKQISEAAQMFLTAYLRGGSAAGEWTEAAADIVVQVKGQVSEEIFDRRRVMRTLQDSVVTALNTELQSIALQRSKLLSSSNQLDGQATRDSLDQRAREIESELALRSSDYRNLMTQSDVTAKAVAEHLPPSATLVEYFNFSDQLDEADSTQGHYLAVVLRRGHPPVLVDLGQSSRVDEEVAAYRRHMTKVTSTGYKLMSMDATSYAMRSRSIWESVWKPLESITRGAKMVMVAPDASLNLVSFSALKDSADSYLIEHYPIYYLSSGRDLLRITGLTKPAAGLFAMGDPDYNATPLARINGSDAGFGPASDSVATGMRNMRSSCGSLAGIQVEQLPSTRKEIEEIIAGWRYGRKEEVTQFLGPRATEDNIKRYSPGRRVVHIATHGFFLNGECDGNQANHLTMESPLLQSGLLLSGANLHGDGADSAGIDDGILTAEEVVALPLNGTQLVVLSACETGLGEVKAGEGVYGLRRAFLLAGAQTVISSLWSVPDKETAAMMSQLYAENSKSLPEVMREIQLAKIAELRASGAVDHPFSWGAFIILGNGQ